MYAKSYELEYFGSLVKRHSGQRRRSLPLTNEAKVEAACMRKVMSPEVKRLEEVANKRGKREGAARRTFGYI